MGVKVKNLCFSYDDKQIFKDLNMDVETGSFVCILGQSGCGKSTLLRVLAGLETPDTGEIIIEEEKVTGPGLDRTMVFQDHGLLPWMTAGENITIALKQKFPKMSKSERKEEAKKRLKTVGLGEEVFNKYPKELSGGMQQRCAIARAFSLKSPVLLMDEPFGALDAVTRGNLQDMLLDLWVDDENNQTVFFITHDVDEAIYLGTDIYLLGQSPRGIIATHHFETRNSITRKDLGSNQKYIDLRNSFVSKINREVDGDND